MEFVNKLSDRSGQPADTWGTDREADKGQNKPLSTCVEPGGAEDVFLASCLLLEAPVLGPSPWRPSLWRP